MGVNSALDSISPEKTGFASIRNQTILGAGMAVLLILGVAIIFYSNMFKLAESARLREQSYLTQIDMQKFFANLRDVETSQRGFLLTENKSYLQPYENAIAALDENWDSLIRHDRASASKQKKLGQVKNLADQKIAEIQRTFKLHSTLGRPAAIQLVNTDQGKQLMDQIRSLIAQIEAEEAQEIKLQSQELQSNTRNTIIFSVIIGLFAIFLFLFIIVLLMREGNARLRLNSKLELEVEERNRINEQLLYEAEERERARLQIDELNKTLELKVNNLDALNKELETFSYSVSHDLRAPLRSIDGFSQALLTKYGDVLDANGKDYLARVRSNTQRMGQLIDDMLALSRLTRGELRPTTFNLSELAEGIIEENRIQDPHRKVTTKIQPDLMAYGDQRLLQAVLQNLLNNAWKFTSQHAEATIELLAFEQEGETIYCVRDDGAGFEMEFVHKLFGTFQRLHAMNEFPGTGIGLATVQRIIHRHGGRVWAEGAVEKGASFYFTLNYNALD